MNIYTYSEARQNLASVLDTAKRSGKVLIKRRDGSTFALMPEPQTKSPLDVEGVDTDLRPGEMLDLVRHSRRTGARFTKG